MKIVHSTIQQCFLKGFHDPISCDHCSDQISDSKSKVGWHHSSHFLDFGQDFWLSITSLYSCPYKAYQYIHSKGWISRDQLQWVSSFPLSSNNNVSQFQYSKRIKKNSAFFGWFSNKPSQCMPGWSDLSLFEITKLYVICCFFINWWMLMIILIWFDSKGKHWEIFFISAIFIFISKFVISCLLLI